MLGLIFSKIPPFYSGTDTNLGSQASVWTLATFFRIYQHHLCSQAILLPLTRQGHYLGRQVNLDQPKYLPGLRSTDTAVPGALEGQSNSMVTFLVLFLSKLVSVSELAFRVSVVNSDNASPFHPRGCLRPHL